MAHVPTSAIAPWLGASLRAMSADTATYGAALLLEKFGGLLLLPWSSEALHRVDYGALALALVRWADAGVLGQVAATAGANAIVALAAWSRILPSPLMPPDRGATGRRMLAFGIRFLPHPLLTLVQAAAPTGLIAQLVGLTAAGVYAIAARFTAPVCEHLRGRVEGLWRIQAALLLCFGGRGVRDRTTPAPARIPLEPRRT